MAPMAPDQPVSAPLGAGPCGSVRLPCALKGSSRGYKSGPQGHVKQRSRTTILTATLSDTPSWRKVLSSTGVSMPNEMTVKQFLRKAQARTVEALYEVIAQALQTLSPTDA